MLCMWIVSVGRRKLEQPNANSSYDKAKQKVVGFDNLDGHESGFKGIDKASYCLGIIRAQSGADGFVKADHDYVLHAANKLRKNRCTDFHLLTKKRFKC